MSLPDVSLRPWPARPCPPGLQTQVPARPATHPPVPRLRQTTRPLQVHVMPYSLGWAQSGLGLGSRVVNDHLHECGRVRANALQIACYKVGGGVGQRSSCVSGWVGGTAGLLLQRQRGA